MVEDRRICPFCGQLSVDGGDARESCACDGAIRYRAMADAIDDYCGDDCGEISREFRSVEPGAVEFLKAAAEAVCVGAFAGAAFTLADGSTVHIGAKVSRRISVKKETKVI